jgi:hypothetical protein
LARQAGLWTVAEDLPDYEQNCNCYQRADDFSAVFLNLIQNEIYWIFAFSNSEVCCHFCFCSIVNNRLFVDTLNRVQQVWFVERTIRSTPRNTINQF